MQNNVEKANLGQIITIGGAFMGFVIGSGFASGQECMQYFTGFGLWGSIKAAVISLVIYAWFVGTVVEDGRALRLENSGNLYNFYLGKYLGVALQWFTPIMLFFVYSMMISAAGSTFEEYYTINGNIGRLLIIAASLTTVLLGLDKLVKIVGRIAPVIMVLTITIGLVAVISNPQGVLEADANMQGLELKTNFDHWALSGFMYAAYMVTAVVPYLGDVGKLTSTSKKNSILGGLFGGGAFVLAVLVLNFALLANIRAVYNLEIPSLYVASVISPVLGNIFSFLLLLGIFTASVPMLYTVAHKVSSDTKSNKYRAAAIVTAIASIFGGQLSFSTMIGIIYPISGYAGVIIILGMIYTKYIKKRKYEDFSEN